MTRAMRRQPPPGEGIVSELMASGRPRYVTRTDETTGVVERVRVKRILGRGKFERRTLAEVTIDGVEYQLHATKGYRRRRVEAKRRLAEASP